ncbi:DedA family protein [Streptomyces sp. NPDC058417]|uniref:DedA family protein n=1 Tax=unclassified Streptomyces TaxID=2593676 RepID=UPI0036475F7E
MTTLALGPSWLDPDYLLDSFGIWGLLLIVFAESGLLIGFFLPGDSLLFTAGLLITSNQLDFPLWAAIALICVAAILGDQAGYMFGKKVGPSLFKRPDSRLFKQENVTKAHEFFEKYGPKSLVLARFVPIVRTFTPIIAGVSGMRYRSFLIFNVIGGVLWGAGVTLLGSWLGRIDFVKQNIEPILLLIVLISVVPIIIEFLRARSKAKKAPQEADEATPAPHQQAPHPSHQPHPPMDDATTRLRRIDEHGQAPYGDQGHGQDRNGHRGEYGNHPYGAQPYPQQQAYPQQQPRDPRQQPYPPQQPYPQQQEWPPQQQPYGAAQQNGRNDGQYADGQYAEGQYGEGQYPDGAYPDGPYPDDRQPQQPYPDAQQHNGQHPYRQGY